MHPAGRALIGLWAGLALLAGGGALVLWRLGPPTATPTTVPASAPVRPAAIPLGGQAGAPVVTSTSGAGVASRSAPTPTPAGIAVAAPIPALQEAAVDFPDRTLPVVAADGRTASVAYAARAGLPASGPQVAILMEGLGLSDALDHAALDTLPPQISFAVSPYADALQRPGDAPLLDQARQDGHELFLSLPMEPAGSPSDTEGTQALSLSIDLAQDRKALFWALSRFPGYVGVTNALGGLRGDRFASAGAFSMVADELGRRGLLYVDAGLAPHEQPAIDPPHTRHADLTIDESPDAADIQARLARLEQLAQSNGSALGIAGPLRPATLDRLRAWSRELRERGIALVPVSALPQPRATPPALPAADNASTVPPAPPAAIPAAPAPPAPTPSPTSPQ